MPRIRIGRRVLYGASAGLIAVVLALGVAELVAAFVRPQASPLVTVGQSIIDLTPPWLKDWAIEKFGAKDKAVLRGGILAQLAVLAMAIGVLAARRIVYGAVGIVLFATVGIIAAATRPAARWVDLIPVLVGAVAAGVALPLLIRALPPRKVTEQSGEPKLNASITEPAAEDDRHVVDPR